MTKPWCRAELMPPRAIRDVKVVLFTGIEWGYTRVSTRDQDLHRQVHALTSHGIPDGSIGDAKRMYVDRTSAAEFCS
jgi:predicted site-specific integrase-resolvase